jgi:hypothetical protein
LGRKKKGNKNYKKTKAKQNKQNQQANRKSDIILFWFSKILNFLPELLQLH